MIDKEFVLVSQGIEIYRTKSQENAVNMVKEYNDEYFDYLQKCYDNYERPADNYVDLEIEYSNEKEKDKEIERLTKQNKALNEMYELTKKEYIRLNNIINELEKWLNEKICLNKNDKDYINGMTFVGVNLQMYQMFLDKLQELKGVDKE